MTTILGSDGELLGEPQGNSGRNRASSLVTVEIPADYDGEADFTITPINPDYQPEPKDDPQEPEA
jgi:hypothetical protein